MNQFTRNLMLWGVISLAMVIVFNLFSQPQHSSQPSVTYSEFLRQAAKGEVSEVVIQGNTYRENDRRQIVPDLRPQRSRPCG